MPQNTTVPNPGVDVGYQNPGTTNLVLDAEVSGTDPVTGAQLTREFVIPVDSITGQSSIEVVIPILAGILKEVRAIRILMEKEATPEIVENLDEIFTPDTPETELDES